MLDLSHLPLPDTWHLEIDTRAILRRAWNEPKTLDPDDEPKEEPE